MRNKKSNIWIEGGYQVFGTEGLKGLKVERLSAKIGVSKSSFYYSFIDFEKYFQELIQVHKERLSILADQESKCQSIDPELIEIFMEYKWDLFFNKQLRFSGLYSQYSQILEEADTLAKKHFVKLWKKDLALNINDSQLESLFHLALENFYFRLNEETIEYSYLSQYFQHMRSLIQNIIIPHY